MGRGPVVECRAEAVFPALDPGLRRDDLGWERGRQTEPAGIARPTVRLSIPSATPSPLARHPGAGRGPVKLSAGSGDPAYKSEMRASSPVGRVPSRGAVLD